ncbi:MAG: patatin-like phospholipase family protein [Planctomycetes bacterium]|nr:patatin-like phospholipase family protein [Planctomycetota bacterium]
MAKRKTSKKKPSSTSKFRILALDGGGIRGLLSATWLDRLEREEKSALRSRCDLVVGSGTGSILAAAVALGIPAREVAELYEDLSGHIFARSPGRLWSNVPLSSEAGPRYAAEGLMYRLRDAFGDATLGALEIEVAIVAYDTLGRAPVIFRSSAQEHAELTLAGVVYASCAAPGLFPAHVLDIEGEPRPLVSGSVVANNPAMLALTVAGAIRGQLDLDEITLVSLGTGRDTRPIPADLAQSWGPSQWMGALGAVMEDGAGEAVHRSLEALLPPARYVRFQIPLADASDDIDDASPANIAALTNAARRYLRTVEGKAVFARATRAL